MMRRPLRLIAVCVILTCAQGSAQTYPARPIKLLVGFPGGGAVDIVARAVWQHLSAGLGQPVVIENRPGAGSNVAIRALIDSPADGYSLMVVTNPLAASMAFYQPPPFDAERDVAPIALVGRVPVVIAANVNSEITSVARLVELTRTRPGVISYASPGNGATPHLATFFSLAAGIRLTHVPYKGGAPAMTDVIGGQLPLVAGNALDIQANAKAGRLRVIAVMSANRSPELPGAPTIAESGYPGFEATVWYGFIAPAATPRAVIDRLHAEVQKALASADMRERMAAVGGDVAPGAIEQFTQLIRSERVQYEKLVREAGFKPD